MHRFAMQMYLLKLAHRLVQGVTYTRVLLLGS